MTSHRQTTINLRPWDIDYAPVNYLWWPILASLSTTFILQQSAVPHSWLSSSMNDCTLVDFHQSIYFFAGYSVICNIYFLYYVWYILFIYQYRRYIYFIPNVFDPNLGWSSDWKVFVLFRLMPFPRLYIEKFSSSMLRHKNQICKRNV